MSIQSLPTSWHVIIAIPAQNEETLIARCLESVLQACRYLPVTISCDIIVFDDGSTDCTRDIAENCLKASGTVVSLDMNNVGLARRLAVAYGLKKYSGPLNHCWIANTDADSMVPPDWLYRQLCLAERKVMAVAGIIDIDTFEEHDDGVPKRFRETYQINFDGSHSHVHGANLGVRADAYLAAGAWSARMTAEDHDLWQRVQDNGVFTFSSSSLKVITSGRRVGRAPNGFAETLAKHNKKKLLNV